MCEGQIADAKLKLVKAKADLAKEDPKIMRIVKEKKNLLDYVADLEGRQEIWNEYIAQYEEKIRECKLKME